MIQIEVFKGVNSIKFYNRFKSDEECLKYLSEIKRPDEAFVCARCSNVHVDEFYIGDEEEGITGVPQNQLKSSLSLHWKSLRMESAEHMRRLLMMLLPNHSDRFLQSIFPKMQKLSPTNGRAIDLLWTNTKLSSGNLKMAIHSHKRSQLYSLQNSPVMSQI